MSTSTNGSRSGGVSILGLLGIAFIVLKLTDVIAWSWLWVLAPFWIPWAIVLGFLLIVGVVLLILRLTESESDRKRREAAASLGAYSRSLRMRRRS